MNSRRPSTIGFISNGVYIHGSKSDQCTGLYDPYPNQWEKKTFNVKLKKGGILPENKDLDFVISQGVMVYKSKTSMNGKFYPPPDNWSRRSFNTLLKKNEKRRASMNNYAENPTSSFLLKESLGLKEKPRESITKEQSPRNSPRNSRKMVNSIVIVPSPLKYERENSCDSSHWEQESENGNNDNLNNLLNSTCASVPEIEASPIKPETEPETEASPIKPETEPETEPETVTNNTNPTKDEDYDDSEAEEPQAPLPIAPVKEPVSPSPLSDDETQSRKKVLLEDKTLNTTQLSNISDQLDVTGGTEFLLSDLDSPSDSPKHNSSSKKDNINDLLDSTMNTTTKMNTTLSDDDSSLASGPQDGDDTNDSDYDIV